MIRVTGVSYTYINNGARVSALEDINLTIPAGQACVLIGPSGCGKTTLLYLLAGLLKPTRGEIRINGARVTRPRRQTAIILQDYGLLPWKTVWKNAALGLALRGCSRQRQQEILEPLLAALGLSGLEKRYPAQLSGGQKQRVAIARALSLEPDTLLMDEPFSALDALTREGLQQTLVDIRRQRCLTTVLVTHNIEEAVFLGQQIVVLTAAPGRLKAVLENPEAGTPDYRFSETFHRNCSRVRQLLQK
ncbi:ABC transporter ATP-binding protein [Neomoorella thermoacetica]|uniref:Taurine import ATP-binding protein TauB n=3 Tax=Neomoorella thermoacetica TaxID=1525 RepID=A0A1D7X6S7_NEOTH|nr:ABC transporter ATP-binding protein [Moorella thermoacetica]AKX92927.1 taurine import ATP-binding protein TauB [Moorella thermoacetica]AKX95480.1 taurine import ATP-binding protein TauB [Moorella thermoacetica]AOQ22597.1 Taurine import ATP-binding protein TauB [Moorella thermoacetica]OIQ10283.1 taurine import ATP-binding protein TauB [Moorella thermoacetica]OIQ11964.1 taurine import ATP-binding protein TauB [Moorella thermoacetica]